MSKKKVRKSGILMPVASLPTPYGIGGFSGEAYDFVDFLKESGQKMWQILPLGPTGYGDSPYQSFSTFAGNPYYIDLQPFLDKGYLTKDECEGKKKGKSSPKGKETKQPEILSDIDYETIYLTRFDLLRKAFEGAKKDGFLQDADFLSFRKENSDWLEDYALYMAVKASFAQKSWIEWDEDIRLRRRKAMQTYQKKYRDEMDFYCFQQYHFDRQWKALKQYAGEKGIQIVGDLPIYVAFDSADTWANPELFQLDKNNLPVGVAGCPPDAFCETGQLWGNPLYRWEYHEETGFSWWIRRIKRCFCWYDVVRIDHFRGFESYWFVPYGDKTAQNGHWVKGPGLALFTAMKKELGELNVIAEDLGFLTKDVLRMVKKTGFPGMKVLQFGFDSDADNTYLPHNYTENSIVYTGTHDNDTTVSWYRSLKPAVKKSVREYLGMTGSKHVEWAMIRAAMASCSRLCVIPMQDYLGLPGEARINTPSTLGENWKWRMQRDALTPELAQRIRHLTEIYGRG